MDLVISYDIATATPAGERRLLEVARLCEQFGVRVQKSVFEARLGEAQIQRLTDAIQDLIDPRADTVVIYRVPGDLADARTTFGRAVGRRHGAPWVL